MVGMSEELLERPLTSEEVCALLSMSRCTLSRRVASGNLPHVRRALAGRLVFPRKWVSAWISGAALESVTLSDGTIVVRPVVVRPIGGTRDDP